MILGLFSLQQRPNRAGAIGTGTLNDDFMLRR